VLCFDRSSPELLLPLHVPDPLREWRLTHVQFFRRSPEVQFVGNRHEATQLAQADLIGLFHISFH